MHNLSTTAIFSGVLEWYALFCLVTVPLAVALFIVAYRRRPAVLKAADKAMEKVSKGAKKGKDDGRSNDGSNAAPGIPKLPLRIGDKYHCRLTQRNRQDLGTDRTWSVDNTFLAEIGPLQGVLEAKRAGRCYVLCGAERVQIYYADIRPARKDWFAAGVTALLLRAAQRSDMLATLKCRPSKIRRTATGEVIMYRHPWGTLQCSLEDGRLCRYLYTIRWYDMRAGDIDAAVEEYMAPLAVDGKGGDRYWTHRSGDGDPHPSSVDYVAFRRESATGAVLMGMGRCWRDGADEDEVAENTEMMARSFADILDARDVPRKLGAPEERHPAMTYNPYEDAPEEDTVAIAEDSVPEDAEDIGEADADMTDAAEGETDRGDDPFSYPYIGDGGEDFGEDCDTPPDDIEYPEGI